MRGMIHIYCGDGKGKTTAAVGLTIRGVGAGKKVLFSQFMKSGKSSELKVLRGLENISVVTCQTVTGFYKNMTPEQRAQVSKDYSAMLQEVLRASDDADLLILDEIISACNHGVVEEAVLCRFLKEKPEHLEAVLTGRNPSEQLLELANYVTEMKKQKHPYDEGVSARLGIEF